MSRPLCPVWLLREVPLKPDSGAHFREIRAGSSEPSQLFPKSSGSPDPQERHKHQVDIFLCWNWTRKVSWGASPSAPNTKYLMWQEALGVSSPLTCGWCTRRWRHPTGSQQLRAQPPVPGRGACSSTCCMWCRAGSPPVTAGQAASGESWESGRHTEWPWNTQGARELERKHQGVTRFGGNLHEMFFTLYFFPRRQLCSWEVSLQLWVQQNHSC